MKPSIYSLEEKLSILKNTNKLHSIKAEFEAEGTRIEELAILSRVCEKLSVPLKLKIGGPLAKRDMYEAFQLGAADILVPMVESSFAVETCSGIFMNLIPSFSGLNYNPKLSINIETKLAYRNLSKIIKTIIENNLPIKNFVIGRSDLSSSLGISDVNSEDLYKVSLDIINQAFDANLETTIGGNLNSESFIFIKKLNTINKVGFESRKCSFSSLDNLDQEEFSKLVNLGLIFELEWLKFKQNFYSIRSAEENLRIEIINRRLGISNL